MYLKKIHSFVSKNKILKLILLSSISKKIFQYKTLFRYLELLIWGGRLRRKFVSKILQSQYRSKYRQEWVLVKEQPHFWDYERHENLLVGSTDFLQMARGFLNAEVIKKNDKLLDIGTGSGFFVKKFYSYKCSIIDSIDIDETAIRYAKKNNFAENINYVLQDAINDPFPNTSYDVIAWDGAIGHFHPDVNDKMLKKISQSLNDNGIFVGSEELGHNMPDDHFQTWGNLGEFRDMFKKYFKYVNLKEIEYTAGINKNYVRKEAFWRCTNSDEVSNRNFHTWY